MKVPKLSDDCFALPRGVDWTPVSDALAHLRENMKCVVETEQHEATLAGERILAQPVHAERSNPPYANSAIDGYGFAHASIGEGNVNLPLAGGRAAAGAPFRGRVQPGTAIRILTGAMIPAGVDTVVMQEDVAIEGSMVSFAAGANKGTNCRAAGEDVARGEIILHGERRLTPGDLALLAATGVNDVSIYRPLRVGVLSTGDEVKPAGTPIQAHQIYDANRPMLLDLIARWGMQPVDLGHAADTVDAVKAALDTGAQNADVILTSGGASAGDEDHIAATLKDAGTLSNWRIALKPGRPLALGMWNSVPVFGLPGNPVAAFVCTLNFARPSLLALSGAGWREPAGQMVPAAFAKNKKPGRREYLRARLDDEGAAEVFTSEGSGRISGLSWADGLVELGDESAEIRTGDLVRYLSFAEFGI